MHDNLSKLMKGEFIPLKIAKSLYDEKELFIKTYDHITLGFGQYAMLRALLK